MTYKDLKDRGNSITKDEMLRVTVFDATRMIVEGRRGLEAPSPSSANVNADVGNPKKEDIAGRGKNKAGLSSFFKRLDAYFVDYSLMGLNVHQNYGKVLQSQFLDARRRSDDSAELDALARLSHAADAMSDYGVAENYVRGGDQVWALLPLCAALTVKVGHHAGGPRGGFLSGYPEFAGWLGKNSSRGRRRRLLRELGHHMNYRISCDATELRLRYVPALRRHLLDLMMDADGPRTAEVISLMDEYGLDRDDVFENLDEFRLDVIASSSTSKANRVGAGKERRFADLDSKAKAAFTREYNRGSHRSQALVDEQGVGKASKKKKASSNGGDGDGGMTKDPDAIDEDGPEGGEDEEEGGDPDDDAEEIRKLFKRGGGVGKKGTVKKGAAGGKKSGKKRATTKAGGEGPKTVKRSRKS